MASPSTPGRGPEPDLGEIAASLRLSVTRLARLLRQQDPAGLSPAVATALGTIWREGPVTLSRLAAVERVTPPTITKLVDKLESLGLVERIADASDGRVCRVAVTDVGRAEIEDIRARRTEWLSARLAELPAADVRRLAAVTDVLENLVRPPDDAAGGPADPADPAAPRSGR